MAEGPTRRVWLTVWRNFIQSLKPKQFRGNYKGTDYFGNKYYEIPSDPQTARRKDSRWFDPPEKEDFDQEIPAEWEAWLRGRREEPPTEKELQQNLAIMQMKKKNALQLEAREREKKGLPPLTKKEESGTDFPRYDEYEMMPGKPKERS